MESINELNKNLNSHEICILFGSQTNTSKFASEELERELWRYGYKTKLSDLDSYDITNLPEENLIIFIVSTTGYGEPPSNMTKFWKFLLKKDLPEDSLCDLNYTIFGLGDSSYEKFNIVAKMLNSRLRQLSASLFHPVGLGDDQHDFGFEGEFDPWCKSIIQNLNEDFFPEKRLLYENLPFTPKYICYIENNNTQIKEKDKEDKISDLNKHSKIYEGKLIKMNYLTSSDALKKTLHIQISTYDSKNNKKEEYLKYNPGDVALIYPKNDIISVSQLMNHLSLKESDILKIEQNPLYQYHFHNEYPKHICCRDLLQSWLNINGIPNRHFCRVAADYAKEEMHKEKLLLFASRTSEGKDEFYRYVVKEKRTYVEFLRDFKSVNIPINVLIELIGRLSPREYSISSSNLVNASSVEITLGVVEYQTLLGRNKKGICSEWIDNIYSNSSETAEKTNNLFENEIMPFTIKTGNFPKINLEDDLILIATGTGIAPFRSLIWERYMLCKGVKDIKCGRMILFFGCRSREKDFLFSEEYEIFQKCDKMNFTLFTAFSRDQNDKIYVQHLIKEQSKLINEMILKNKSYIFLVGNSKILPKSIDTSLIYVLTKENKIDNNEAVKILNSLKKNNNFFIETW